MSTKSAHSKLLRDINPGVASMEQYGAKAEKLTVPFEGYAVPE